MKSKKLENTPKVKEVIVNLDQKTKNPEEVSDGKIIVAYKRNILGSRDPEGTGTIEVDYTLGDNVRDKVIVDKNLPLLTLSCVGSKKKDKSVDLEIKKTNEIPFTVRFDSNAIIDCIDPDVEQFDVDYTVTVTMDSDKESKEVYGKIIIKLQKLDCKPMLSLKTREMTYNATKVENILRIENSNTHAYARTLSLKPTAVYLERDTEKLMNIVELSCEKASPNGINKDYVRPCGVTITDDYSANPSDYVRRIFPKAGYEMDVPLYIDLTKINNPIDEREDYNLVVEYEYWTDNNSGNPVRDQKSIAFTLLRNDERNELRVELKYGGQTVTLDRDYEVPNIKTDNSSYKFHISVRNAAKVKQRAYPQAGVVISDFSIDRLKFDGVTAFKGNTKVDVSDFVTKKVDGKSVQSGQVRILPSESVDINLNVRPGQITRFINANGTDVFKAYLRQHIHFKYFIDNTGKDTPGVWQEYDDSVSLELEIPPKNECLCVDFGTSAVVALYGNSFNIENARESDCICDLGAIKKELLKAAYGPNSDFAKVEDESVFINSNIVLNDSGTKTDGFSLKKVGGKFETNYKQAKALFSPGEQFDHNKLTPSLKSMMGHKRVPSKDTRRENREKMPLVDDVYQTAYNQLFDLYLSRLSNGDRVERIAMTYPNTFATMHVEKLKNMAKKCLPTLRDDCIDTISESDAIAYKYLRHRNQFVSGENADQHVLVYDMGAGTLDITYFKNILNSDNVRDVDIVGKYGISKAGNYLDYVLAEIVVELCEEAGHDNVGGVKLREYISYSPDRSLEIGTCYELKKYIRNSLKPLMAKYKDASSVPDDMMMPEWEGKSLNLASIPLKKVFQSPKFTSYIKSISNDVVEGLRANINNIKVDVVVFSGRMTCFESIRMAVVDSLNADKPIIVDIANGRDSSSLKSSVVEGALDYVEKYKDKSTEYNMHQRPFYCNYCVLVKSDKEIDEVHCMMNNMTEGYMATERVNLSNAIAIYLLQTYAADADAVKKDFEGERDLTTILVARSVLQERGLHDLAVEVDDIGRQGTNYVKLMLDAGEVEALPQENLDSEAFRKSSWPVVFV